MTLQAVPSNVVRFPVERRRPRRLLNLHELRELFGMSERWFRYRIAEGMPCHRCGKLLRFDPAEVEAYLAARYGRPYDASRSTERRTDAPKAR